MRRFYGPSVAAMGPHQSLLVSDLATAGTTIASATLVISGVTAAIGDMLVLGVAADNAGASGVASMSTTVTDSAGNAWTNRGGMVNRTAASAANDGTTLGMWTAPVTAALTAGSVTVSFSPDTASKAAIIQKVSPAVGEQVNFSAVGVGVSGAGTSFSTGTIAAVPNGYTVFGFVATENNNPAVGDADTTNGAWTAVSSAVASGANQNASQSISTQHKTVTATGDQSWDTTIGSSKDYALNWLILFGAS